MASQEMEKQLLIDEVAASNPSSGPHTSILIPDIVITLPRFVPGGEESGGWLTAAVSGQTAGQRTFDAEQLSALLTELDMNVFETDEKSSIMYTKCKKLTELLTEDKGKQVTLDLIQNVIMADFVEYLWDHGCPSSAFMSCDGDELFVLISLGESTCTAQVEEHEVAIKAAVRHGMRLQSRYNAACIGEMFNMKQDMKPGEEMYKPLVRDHHHKSHYDIYKRYSASIAGTHGSILRAVDRYRLLKGTLSHFIDLDEALGLGVINDYYIPHNMSKLDEFRCGKAKGEEEWDAGHPAWSSFSFQTIMAGLRHDCDAQPITEIRDYFGCGIGFYFLWLAFTARFFAIMCLPSICLSVVYSMSKNEMFADPHLFAAVFYSVSMTVYLKMWTRLETHYVELWDVEDRCAEHVLPNYRGDPTPDEANGNVKTKIYPFHKALGALLVSRAIAVVFVCFVIVTVALVYMLEELIPHHFPSITPEMAVSITSAIFSVQVFVYQLVWDYLCGKLVDLSNPRTEEEALDLAVDFLFPVSMVSTYANIIYHAFYKSWGSPCTADNCMLVLRPAMVKVVLPAMLMQIIYLFKPYVMYRYQLYAEKKRLLSRSRPDAGTEAQVDRSFIEVQAKRPPFSAIVFYQQMNLVTIFFGYFALFGFVTPGITLAIAIMFLLKVRIDAFKLCSIYQRVAPLSSGRHGIGEWNTMLQMACYIGRWTSIAIPIFNLDVFQNTDSYIVRCFAAVKLATDPVERECSRQEQEDGLTFYQKLLLICILKMLTDMLCSAVARAIPDVSIRTKMLRRKREAVRLRDVAHCAASEAPRRDRRISGDPFSETSEVAGWAPTEKKWYETLADGSLKRLDSSHPDWGKFENKDFAPLQRLSTYIGRALPVGADPEALTS